VLDAGWDVLFWDLWGTTGFGQAEPATPPSLELLVRRYQRMPDPALAAAYYQLAKHEPVGSSRWHQFMWDSIRVFPTGPVLTAYLVELDRTGDFNEAAHYRTMRDLAQ
jgi:hypothetical protein